MEAFTRRTRREKRRPYLIEKEEGGREGGRGMSEKRSTEVRYQERK